MMGARSALQVAVGASILAALVLGWSPAWSEVGVVADPASPTVVTAAYAVGVIVDDPGPIGTIWQQYNDTPHHVVLNPNGLANQDGPPSIVRVANPPGPVVILVAWARNSPAGYDVVVSTFENGAWTTPQVIAGGPDDELDPQLTVGSDGTVHLFYWRDSGSSQEVLYRQAPADLSSWSVEEQVSSPGQAACRPSGADHAGVLRVAYEIHDFGFEQTPRQVVLARREGATFIEEVLSVSQHGGVLRPEVHSHDGVLWVDWIDSDVEAAWLRKDAQGYWEPKRYEPYTGVQERDYSVRNIIRIKALE